jgi:hypothetical protein
MKNSTYKNLLEIFKSKGVLAVSSGLLLISCGAQMGGYTETDGVYYDPNKDVIPAGVTMQDTNNNVGEDYSYTDNSESIIEQNQQNIQAQKNKYQDWNNFDNQIGEAMQELKLIIILIIGVGDMVILTEWEVIMAGEIDGI